MVHPVMAGAYKNRFKPVGHFVNVFGTLPTDNVSMRIDTASFSNNFSYGIFLNADCYVKKFEVYGSTFNTNDGLASARGIFCIGQNKDTIIVQITS